MCEFIITSDKEFLKAIGEEETKRYFEAAYKFVANMTNSDFNLERGNKE